jgi:hypothetical protein
MHSSGPNVAQLRSAIRSSQRKINFNGVLLNNLSENDLKLTFCILDNGNIDKKEFDESFYEKIKKDLQLKINFSAKERMKMLKQCPIILVNYQIIRNQYSRIRQILLMYIV